METHTNKKTMKLIFKRIRIKYYGYTIRDDAAIPYIGGYYPKNRPTVETRTITLTRYKLITKKIG